MIGAAARALCGLLLLLAAGTAVAQEFQFRAPASPADPATPAAMRDLAERLLPVYQEPDQKRYLANLAALQMVAGTYPAALDSRRSLRDRRRAGNAAAPLERSVVDDLYAQARALEARDRLAFPKAFSQAFGEVVPKLGDRDAYLVMSWLGAPPSAPREALQKAFDRLRPRDSVTQPEALELVNKYLAYDTYRNLGPLVAALDLEEQRRRYITEDDVLIRARGGVEIRALVVRPKTVSAPLPALLEFTILLSGHDARASAARGYVGVVAYTRGRKGQSRNRVIPFQNDGEDARAVIGWITQQPWSDGRVGMVGAGYSGFAAWAAARRLPEALKAVATASPMAPGIDFPMAGNVFRNSSYHWVQAHTKATDGPPADEAARRALDRAWYESGKRYRDLDRVFGPANRVFRRWLNHPSYDGYWRKMIPYRKQFAQVDIPVLTIAGYYGSDAGALHYFREHQRYAAQAEHTLLLGPYDDAATAQAPAASLRGLALDAAALVDLRELRYQWLDHVFKGAARPALLKDRVNYEVMGANEWRHAPSIEAMANGSLRFYLETAEPRRLLPEKPATPASVEQRMDLADRSDAALPQGSELVGRSLAERNGLVFASEPLQQPLEFAGLPAGLLDFAPNRQDLDLELALYELLPGGSYQQLCDPYEFRASYAKDRTRRRLLRAGERQQLAFASEHIASRRLQAGSRLVLVLRVIKRPDREINYGAGKDVSEETVADTRPALKIRWYNGSYIELPVRR